MMFAIQSLTMVCATCSSNFFSAGACALSGGDINLLECLNMVGEWVDGRLEHSV